MTHTPRTHPQDLREAFTSIITMMLGLLRAQGLRGLLQFPQIVLVVFLLRAIAKRFTALMDAHAAGTLPPAPPYVAPPLRHPALAQPRHRSVRGASSRQPRQRTQPGPAKPARAGVRVRPCPT